MPDNTYNDYGTPLTRAEAYLAQIAQNTTGDGSAEGIGNTYNDYGTPLTRAEALLATIMENTAGGGGGGGAGGGLVVTVTASNGYYIMDKTWQEIYDAFCGGCAIAVRYTHSDVTETGETFQDTADSVNVVEETFIKENGEFTDHYLGVSTSYLGGFEAQSKTDYPKSQIW